jgi:beta-lactamase regulating signal transducer with metallopeptidase domain
MSSETPPTQPQPQPSSPGPGDEVVIFQGRNSWVRLIGPTMHSLLWLCVAILLLASHWICVQIAPHPGETGAWASFANWIAHTMGPIASQTFFVLKIVGWVIFALLVVARMLHAIWTWAFTHNLLTTSRIEHERGFFSKTVTTLELWRVQDMEYDSKFFWDFFFRTGRIKVKADVPIFTKADDFIGPMHKARSIFDQLKKARLKAGQKAGAQAMGVASPG